MDESKIRASNFLQRSLKIIDQNIFAHGAQFASIAYDDSLTAWRSLVNTLKIYIYSLQRGADVDISNATCEKMTSSTNRSKQCIALLTDNDWGKKFVSLEMLFLKYNERTDMQTDKQISIATLRKSQPYTGEVII